MVIELFYVPGCPNLALARDRLAAAAVLAGVGSDVHEQEVTSEAGAVALGMRGSPTIRIDGVDVGGSADVEASLSCRLYRTEAGSDGAPSVAALVSALGR